jgi:hypothetical protein
LHTKRAHTAPVGLLAKKEKTEFFLLCGKQAKINALIFLIFYCAPPPVCDRLGFVSSLTGAYGARRIVGKEGKNGFFPSLW